MPKFDGSLPAQDGLGFVGRIYKHLADKLTLTPERSTDNVVQAQTATAVPFVVKRFSSGATADLIQVQDETGTVLSGFSFLGSVYGGSLAYDVTNTAYAGGAKGDGVTDDTAAIQAAFTAALATNRTSATVRFPAPSNYYKVTGTITIQPPSGAQCQLNIEGPPIPSAIRYEGANSGTVFKAWGWKNSNITNVNVLVTSATDTVVWDLDVDVTRTSTGFLVFNNCRASLANGNNNIGWRMGHTGGVGSELSFIDWIDCVANATDGSGTGQIGWVNDHSNALNLTWNTSVGYFLDKAWTNTATSGAGSAAGGDSMFFFGCGTSQCSVDFEFRTAGTYAIFGGRYELGKKFLVVGNGSTNLSVSVRGVKLGGYSPADNCVFDWANITYNGGRPGNLTIDDLTADATDYTAAFITYQGVSTRPSKLTVRGGGIRSLVDPIYTLVTDAAVDVELNNVQQLNSSIQPVVVFSTGVRSLTYSASITPKRGGGVQTIIATNGTAFTINAPTLAAKQDRLLVLDVKNSSGGALGAITWDAAFLLAGAFTNPANGKRRTISFYCDGTNWVETNRAAADI